MACNYAWFYFGGYETNGLRNETVWRPSIFERIYRLGLFLGIWALDVVSGFGYLKRRYNDLCNFASFLLFKLTRFSYIYTRSRLVSFNHIS